MAGWLACVSPDVCKHRQALEMAGRERTTPLTYAQKLFLVKQIRDNPIAHRKPTDYSGVLARKAAWERITLDFSVTFSVSEAKTQDQLKRTWEYLKKKEKKDHSHYIRNTHKTGGGTPPPPPKPADELSLLVQLILADDLPRPTDILDSECVQMYQERELHQPTYSNIEYEAPTEGVCTGQPKQPQTLVENHGSPIVIIGSSKREAFPTDAASLGQPEVPKTSECPDSPIRIIASAEHEFSGQDTGHLPCSSTPNTSASQPDQSFKGRKRKAADTKAAAYKKCAKKQIEFREKLDSKLDTLIEKAGKTLEKISSAADEVGSSANRIASAAERLAAALERVADRF